MGMVERKGKGRREGEGCVVALLMGAVGLDYVGKYGRGRFFRRDA